MDIIPKSFILFLLICILSILELKMANYILTNCTNIQKRFLLFLFGCITTRILFVIIAFKINKKYLPFIGYFALIPAIMFMYLYLFNLRKIGNETFGDKIWWMNLRPIHSMLYFIFAYMAINQNQNAYKPLLIDVSIGLISFLVYHQNNNNIQKLFIN